MVASGFFNEVPARDAVASLSHRRAAKSQHWLTDVLGGYALGAFWAAVVVVVMLIASAREARGSQA